MLAEFTVTHPPYTNSGHPNLGRCKDGYVVTFLDVPDRAVLVRRTSSGWKTVTLRVPEGWEFVAYGKTGGAGPPQATTSSC